MTSSSRRLRRSLPRGGRLALVVPTALLAITAMVSPSFAEDVPTNDGGDTSAVTETPASDPAPQPEPELEPKAEPKSEPKPEPKSEPKPDPAPASDQKSSPTPGAAFADAKAVEVAKAKDDAPGQEDKPEKDDDKKVVVCKYVSTPDGVESHIIVVSVSALGKDWDGKFPAPFADAQDSVAIRFAIGNEQPGDEELENCPQDEVAVPTVPVNDPCGPDNAVYGEVPDGPYTVVRNPSGSITLTADGGYDFPGGADQYVFDAPVDSNEPCDEPAEIDAPEVPVIDECGVGNAVYGDVPDGPYEVVRNEDGSITLTALGDATFAGGEPTFDYPVPVETNTEECEVDEKKVVVCKYVSTPGGELDHIIIVNVSALGKDWDGKFPAPFADAQDSVAIRYAEEGEQAKDVLDIECIGDEPAEIDAPEVPVIDECAPDNAMYGEVPMSDDYSIAYNEDGSITLTALGELTFPGGELTFTYPVPVEENTEACPEVDDTRVVLCTYPDMARVTTLLGTIQIVDLADLLAEGFTGVFPFDFSDGDSFSTAIRFAFEGETAEDIDAVVCGVDSAEEVPGEVAGIEETAALPNTGGPAGWLVPLGAALMMAGAALVMARRPSIA